MIIHLFKRLFTQKCSVCTVCQKQLTRQELYTFGKTQAYPLCVDCICDVANFDQCLDSSLHPKQTHAQYRSEALVYLREIEGRGNGQALDLLKEIQVFYGVQL